MTDYQKKEIQMLLKTHIEQYPSQSKAVQALQGVSEATVINIRRADWESISDEMWTKVGKQVGYGKGKWQMIETQGAKMLINFLDDAREFGNVFAVTANSGSGKSFVSEWYENKRPNAYTISCSEYFNRKDFLREILKKLGKNNTGYSVTEMMEVIVEVSLKKENPLFIFDEFDKVSDSILYFFITLYNRLEGNAGIVMMATDHLAKRIMRGRKNNKKGYQEIFSRIGRRFISLPEVTQQEVFDIARANGVTDKQELHSIYNECDGDLRRVKRSVHKSKVRQLEKSRLKNAQKRSKWKSPSKPDRKPGKNMPNA
jgi:Cdc6-like AAA superfamily ATPase